ncbi:unnamed protein product [Cladocopium goreaui]|uniref:Retrovirus-related Pol polyprotein from transposon TNT 1-94 n=1 Tax=Cladocopium goreaui TaxID=2562237 RepID=A0A9P1FQL8_9DINO|nr:unnamed protein product [Cladocopium goreaui]
MASLSADNVAQLVQAATDAAKAASEAVLAMKEQQTARAGLSDGFKEASKVIRQPEPFGSEVHEEDLGRWQDFNVNFRAWLFYGNKHFEGDLHRIESVHGDIPIPSVDGEAPEVQDRCSQLYSILTGLLRGKPLRMLRQVERRNGFEVWRQLSQMFQPKTKSRAISILSALVNVPNFVMKDRTLLDQILGLERLRAEYVRASGSDIADDVMLSVLVRALPKALQQHVQLQMSETSSYDQVRAMVISYERTTTSWSAGKIHSELGILSSAATANDQCLHCGRYGHFKRDCWKLHGKPDSKKVNQVESQTATSTATSSSGGGPSISPPSTAAASSVRLFTSLDHMHGPLIEDLDDLEVCDLTMHDSSGFCNMVSQMHDGLDTLDSTCDGVYMECCECFDMSYSDSDSNWTICDFSDDTALQIFSDDIALQPFLAFVKEMVNHFQSEQLAFLSQETWRWCWILELMALCCRWSTATLASLTLRLMVLHLLMHKDGTWDLEEFSQSISELSTMVAPFDTNKRVTEVITIAHTSVVPPEALGFAMQSDDVVPRQRMEVIAPRSGIPLQASGSADRPMGVEPAEEVPAAEDAELPVPERDAGPEPNEILIDGVKLDSNTTLKTLRTACESLGLATGGSKKTCLKRLWDHLQAQEMIAAHGAKTQLQAELQRPVHAQPVPTDPTDKERADHMLTHQPYAAWCELCVANKAVQDQHPQRVEASGDHSCVSFDFGYASRFDGETKACGLFIHDRDTGSHASNGGAEVTVKVLRQNANVLIQQLEQGLTPYEICSGRSYNGRLALFGESVLGFLKVSTKGATPWQFGYASLGSQLVLAKRISSPAPLSLPQVPPRDLDVEAVMGVPPTPDEHADDDVGPVPATPAMPRVLAPPSTSVSVPARREPDDDMEVSAEAGITAEHGTSAPVTPPVEGATSSTVSAGGAADVSVHGTHVHQRDDVDEGGDSRPSKQPRLLRFCEHEENSHVTHFESDELDALEVYEFELDDDEDDSEEPQLSSSTCSDDVLKLLTVPFTTLEPDISGEQLLRLDMLADRVEIERLKSMQVLLPVETYDCKGQTTEFMLGRVLPGQRNGSQLWHECFSNLLKSELGFVECEAYPCLLRTAGSECLLMLHVDDVLCLSNKDYLECVLLPALKAKFKISCEKVENPGDELTFLKRRHMLLSENELAVQSHPKHLERLFDLMHINRNLKPKRTPGHPMLDEPDDTAELGPSDAHHGLLHYNELDYTLEVYSDSDWAKHKTTRSQKALALSSAEAEIYSAAGACCDGVLMFYCLSFAIGPELEIYDLSSSSFVGSNAAESVKQKEVMKQGVKVFTKHGSSPQESKRLMRILLLSALSLPESMAMEFNVSTGSSTTASTFWWQLLCMVLMTALCIALGWIFYLQWQINALQGKCSKLSIDTKLYKVLDLLKGYKDKMLRKHESGEEENQESDPIVENPDTTSDVHTMASGDATRGLDPQTVQLMRDTNSVLRARYDRLESLYEEAEIVQDEDAMYTLQNQMDEVMQLMYDI